MPPLPFRRTVAAAALLALAGCIRIGAGGPELRVDPAPDVPTVAAAPGTLREAARRLDTLYVPPASGTPGERAVAAAIRDVRLGRMVEAAQRLAPVVAGADSAAAVGREVIGQLLLHLEQWGAVAGSPGPAAPLFAAYARAERETWAFPADSVVLPLEVTRVGTPVVEVLVNGRPHRFWVDTGAGLTVLSSTLAADVGVQASDSAARAGTSTSRGVAARPAIIGELRLGDVVVRNHPAMVLDARDLEVRALGGMVTVVDIDGILGWPLLRKLDFTLDYAGRRMIVRQPRPRDVASRNLFWLGYPAVAARAENGRELLLGLDTGASASSLSPRFLSVAGVAATGTRTRRVGGAGGFETVAVQTVEEAALLLDGWRVRLGGVDVRLERSARALDLDGILGSDVAGLGAVRIDFLNGRFDFQPVATR